MGLVSPTLLLAPSALALALGCSSSRAPAQGEGGPRLQDSSPIPDAGDVKNHDALADVQPVVRVTMNGYDKVGSGSNSRETLLNVNNVSASQFGLRFTRPVDGYQSAQPLFMSRLVMQDANAHDVVFVATANDSVYAFDASDTSATAPLWHASVGTSAPYPNHWFGSPQCKLGSGPAPYQIGVASTPAIDPTTSTMYLVAFDVDSTHMIPGSCSDETSCMQVSCMIPTAAYKLHALDIFTGQEKPGSPVTIAGSVSGTGARSVGGKLAFDPLLQRQRSSLLIDYGNVYFSFASYDDMGDYHGWIFAYDEATLKQRAVFVDTPDGVQGGIWMSGRGLVSDEAGSVYVVTGNGTFDLDVGGRDYGDAIIRLDAKTLAPQDWFSPFLSHYDGQNILQTIDDDLGSAGATFIPGTSLVLATGKSGTGYLIDRAHMGHFRAGSDNVVQKVRLAWRYDRTACSPSFGWGCMVNSAPIAWVGPDATHVYVWAGWDYLRHYVLDHNGMFSSKGVCFCAPGWQLDAGTSGYTIDVADPPCAVIASESPDYVGSPTGGTLAVSSNGNEPGTGIVWGTHPIPGGGYAKSVTGVMEAYDATDVSKPIWSTTTNPARDGFGNWAKYTPPTVANGRVYVATQSNQLAVYGLLSR